MTDFLQTLDERSDGIGAADGDRVSFPKFDGPIVTISTGHAHWVLRFWANWERKRAFDRIPAYAVLEPAGNHTFGATKAELRLGCPAWPVKKAHKHDWYLTDVWSMSLGYTVSHLGCPCGAEKGIQ